MGNAIVQANYAELEAIARSFGELNQTATEMQSQIRNAFEPLQAGGWIGRGSDAFCAEMNSEMFPTINKLILALEAGRAVTLELSAKLRQAEQEAAAIYQVGGPEALAALKASILADMGNINPNSKQKPLSLDPLTKGLETVNLGKDAALIAEARRRGLADPVNRRDIKNVMSGDFIDPRSLAGKTLKGLGTAGSIIGAGDSALDNWNATAGMDQRGVRTAVGTGLDVGTSAAVGIGAGILTVGAIASAPVSVPAAGVVTLGVGTGMLAGHLGGMIQGTSLYKGIKGGVTDLAAAGANEVQEAHDSFMSKLYNGLRGGR